jgi:soluble lytic murein transglycosylase
MHGARQLDPAANGWYREAAGAPMTDEQHQWRVRAALRAKSWQDVMAAVDAMPPALAREPAWLYWRARALAAEGRNEEARAIYAALATEFNFYALLAAEALGQPIEPRSEPIAASPEALSAYGARPGVRRAVKLAQLDMRVESLREWNYVIRGADDESLLTAAEFARQAGLYDRAINTAERTTRRHDFALRYLRPFESEFVAAARQNGIDDTVLLAIARQESRFSPTIVSSAGATGLMQLMPATARWVAKQLGRNDFKPAMIADVDVNTQFGAYYFKYWLDRLDGRQVLATAAYNAGPSRAQAWRPASSIEGAAWVESIPFNETRDYVKKVLANAMFYNQALSRPPQTLTERLGTVTPRSPGAADAAIAGGAP